MTWELKQRAKKILSRETGTLYKPSDAKLRIALVFPNTYKLGMSNLGFQTIYRIFNEIPDVVCERAFLPEPEDLQEFRRTKTHLFSLDTQTPLREFDVVAFSVTFEMDAIYLLEILDLAGISLHSADRTSEEPLVIAGGPAVTINPEPLSPFVDAFAIGEGEEMCHEITENIVANFDADRVQRIKKLAEVTSVYVPILYQTETNPDGTVSRITALENAPLPVQKRVVKPLDQYEATSLIITPDTEFGEIRLTEVARGCARGCRFCVASHAYRPARFRSTEGVLRSIDRFPKQEDSSVRIGLIGSSVSDNPQIALICKELISRGFQITASSLRADSLGPELAEELAHGGQLTATIAPEAGTDRLRNVIGKHIPEDEFFRVIHELVKFGIERVKLYYMLGLPTETDEDADAIADLSLRLWDHSGLKRLTIGVSPFVPKSFTPFQWHPMEDLQVLNKRLKSIQKAVRRIHNVEVSFGSPREALFQTILSRGGREISGAILACYQNGGHWAKAFKECGIDPAFYAYRKREKTEIFPWEVVYLNLTKEFLWRQYQKGLREE